MKSKLFTIFAFFSMSAFASHKHAPDIPPDANSELYQSFLRTQPAMPAVVDGLNDLVAAGERNLNWLKHINSLIKGPPLSFTSKDKQRGIQIDKPNEYNEELVLEKLSDLMTTFPAEMKAVIFDGAVFTDTPPIAVEDYLEFGRKLDVVYQSATRWRLMQPYLDELADRASEDVRGYYFLSREPDRATKLANYAKLPDGEKAQIHDWLFELCLNSAFQGDCRQNLDAKISSGADLEPFYQEYLAGGQTMWNGFFNIPDEVARKDFTWSIAADGSSSLTTPFKDPITPEVQHFVQFDVQDEWHFENWHLDLPFIPGDDSTTHIEFQPGVTPHVNGLGGNTITMNANQPLTEYDAQWTIRHEYGHVLGFPDCYVEFYVRSRNVIINYQLDIDDIMCSRRGHVKDINVNELRRVYGHAAKI